MSNFENNKPCIKCKGKCCKHMPCHLSPDDIQDKTYEGLKKLLNTGIYSIDWWDGLFSEEYYIRIRIINKPIVHPAWGGRCILLDDKTGCKLPFNKRPKGARYLLANDDFLCKSYYTKEDCKNDWLKYNDILGRLRNDFSTK